MKNLSAFTALIAFSMMVFSTGANAQCAMHGGGPREGGPMMQGPSAFSLESIQKFNKETKVFQEQLIDKQAALQKEFLKDDPDPEAIATIRKAIIDIEKEIQKVAKKLGIKQGFGSCCMNHAGGTCGCFCRRGGMGMGGCCRR